MADNQKKYKGRKGERNAPITMSDRRQAQHARAAHQLQERPQGQAEEVSHGPTHGTPQVLMEEVRDKPTESSRRFVVRLSRNLLGSGQTVHEPSLSVRTPVDRDAGLVADDLYDEGEPDSEDYDDDAGRAVLDAMGVDDNDDEAVLPESSSSYIVVKRAKTGRFVGSSQIGSSNSSVGKGKGKSKGKDKTWILEGPCAGGPIVPSVIPSFKGHVACGLWSGETRPVLTCYNRKNLVSKLMGLKLSKEVQGKIEATGLSHIGLCSFEHLNINLLSAFVERWQPDTNTFHMPFGEMTILLHDVERILGLSIDGRCCRPPLDSRGKTVDDIEYLCFLLGKTKEEIREPRKEGVKAPIYRAGGVLIDEVRRVLDGKATDDDKAKAWLFMMAGSTLFVDKSSDRIRPHVFPMLSKLGDVGKYAWGVGVLAYLYRQLGIASRSGVRGLCGCLPLLEAWIYEYFPCLRTRPSTSVFQGEPRVSAWRLGPKFTADETRVERLRENIDHLTPDMVTWIPGGRSEAVHPRSLFLGFIRFMEITEPYHPDRCLRKFGYIPVVPAPMFVGNFYRPRSGLGYDVDYGVYTDSLWEARHFHRVVLDSASIPYTTPTEGVRRYLEWYRRHSHPLLIDPSTVTSHVVHEVPDRVLYPQVLLFNIILSYCSHY